MDFLIETERLEIRPFYLEDLRDFQEIAKDIDVMKFSKNGPLDEEESKKLFKKIFKNKKKYGFGAAAILDKKTKTFLGFCLLSILKKDGIEEFNVGYRFFKKYWGKGYASEALKVCIEHLKKVFKDRDIYLY